MGCLLGKSTRSASAEGVQSVAAQSGATHDANERKSATIYFSNHRKRPDQSQSFFDLGKLTKTKGLKIPVDSNGSHVCPDCGRIYKLKSSLRNHQKWECGKEPQFKCPFCSYRAKQKMHMLRHTERMHKGMDFSTIKKEMITDDESPALETSDNDEVKDLSLKSAAGDGKTAADENPGCETAASGSSK